MMKLEEDIRNYNDRNTVILEHKSALESTLKQGIEQGIEQEKIIIARKMKSKNLDVYEIADFTGLSIDEINAL